MATVLLMNYTHVFEAETPKQPVAYVQDGGDFVPIDKKVADDAGDFSNKSVKVFIDGEWKDVS